MTSLTKRETRIIVFFILASLVLATAAPLLTYSVGLACFGFTHIVREIYFIDHRFGARMPGSFALTLGVLLLMVMLTRAASVFGLAEPRLMYSLELIVVMLLVSSTLFFIPANHALSRSRFTVALVAVLLGIGFVASPNVTIVTLAVLHNLTPLGFMVEIAKPDDKKLTFWYSTLVFVALPLMIACGLFNPIATVFGHIDQLSIFPTGPLEKHFGVFLPGSLKAMPWASLAFSAVVFAQCMHYLAVIYVMPKMLIATTLRANSKPLIPWPKQRTLWLIVAILTAALTFMYWQDFFFARSVYGIAAALHAYVEIPMLLWAFSFPSLATPLRPPAYAHR